MFLSDVRNLEKTYPDFKSDDLSENCTFSISKLLLTLKVLNILYIYYLYIIGN